MTWMRKTPEQVRSELLQEAKMLRDFLQETREELDRIVHSHDFSVQIVRSGVAAGIELLIEDRFIGAIEALRMAYRALCRAKTQVDPEAFHEALCALDLGCFASNLWVHFRYFWEDERSIIYQIWHARKDFYPNLADVFELGKSFVFRVRLDRQPGFGFYYALKRPNEMYATFGQSCLYGDKPIGHILSETAMKKLKELFRAYVRERKSDAGGRV